MGQTYIERTDGMQSWAEFTPNEPCDSKILVNNNAKFEQTKQFSLVSSLKIVLPPVIAIISYVR